MGGDVNLGVGTSKVLLVKYIFVNLFLQFIFFKGRKNNEYYLFLKEGRKNEYYLVVFLRILVL